MISAATITTTRSTLTTTILRSSSRCLSSTAAATGGSESSLTNQSSEKNEIKIPKYYDALRVEGRKQMSPQRVKELAEYGRQKSIEAKSKSPLPTTFTDYCTGDIEPLPENPRELSAISGMPDDHQNRTVVIRQRPGNAMQFGDNYSHQWQITWQSPQKWSNPLTGYVSGADPMGTVKLYFNSQQGAIDFASRNGWKYEVHRHADADVREPGWRGYKHNFLPKAVASLPKKAKKEWFSVSKYGSSHFVMPLKYHGDGIVSQHGGE